jgi:pimeloyl-ACP methyl ester carboxylesterase
VKMSGGVRRRARPTSVRSGHVQVGRSRLHYRVAGEGPPLVLVHGYSGSSSWWRNNIRALATRRRVYALDLVGFGRSWPKHYFSLERGIAHIVSWMDQMGIEQTDFCGHSMGGHICMRLAAAHPRRVRKLVLANASGLPLNARLLPLAWRGVRSSGHTRFRFAPTVVNTALQAGPLVLWSALRDLLADDVQEELAHVTAPTLIIWGEADVLVPVEIGQALHLAIGNSRLIRVPGAGHNVMYERPIQFNRAVLTFLDE